MLQLFADDTVIVFKGRTWQEVYQYCTRAAIQLTPPAYREGGPVQSILQYGIIAWGGAFKTIIDPLNVIQKSILKAALNKPKRFSSNELFIESDILTIRGTWSNYSQLLYQGRCGGWCAGSCHRDDCEPDERILRGEYILQALASSDKGPLSLFKQLITTWLRMVGFDNAESLLTLTYHYLL
ncbi:hypothetical protein J6590_087770 [Homalodisca vitripennis]|nr:hypothetical protein J6590_087770 [Homalodisca vitripennis]